MLVQKNIIISVFAVAKITLFTLWLLMPILIGTPLYAGQDARGLSSIEECNDELDSTTCPKFCQRMFPETSSKWIHSSCDVNPQSNIGHCSCRVLSADEIGPITGKWDNYNSDQRKSCRRFCGSYQNKYAGGDDQCMLNCLNCLGGGFFWATPERPTSTGHAGCCYAVGSSCGEAHGGWRLPRKKQ